MLLRNAGKLFFDRYLWDGYGGCNIFFAISTLQNAKKVVSLPPDLKNVFRQVGNLSYCHGQIKTTG